MPEPADEQIITLPLPRSGKHCRIAVRRSSRARRLSLRVPSDGRVALVLPPHVSTAAGREFLCANLVWLERALSRREAKRARSGASAPAAYPEKMDFALTGLSLNVEYRYQSVCWTGAKLDAEAGRIIVTGNILEAELIRDSLRNLVLREGEALLGKMLREVATETGLGFKSLHVKLMRGRWGSCSARKDIVLNAFLLFHPRECVRYVMIHELCHTLELNHSAAFWSLVRKFEPSCVYFRSLLARKNVFL